jgi:hypothetical protein
MSHFQESRGCMRSNRPHSCSDPHMSTLSMSHFPFRLNNPDPHFRLEGIWTSQGVQTWAILKCFRTRMIYSSRTRLSHLVTGMSSIVLHPLSLHSSFRGSRPMTWAVSHVSKIFPICRFRFTGNLFPHESWSSMWLSPCPFLHFDVGFNCTTLYLMDLLQRSMIRY